MVARAHARAGKIVFRDGRMLGGDCPCPCGGGGTCDVCPDLTLEQEFLATITGVTGGGGRCDSHNASLVLTYNAPCWYAKIPAYPPPEDSEGCEFSLWNPTSAVVLKFLTESGVLKVEITDSIGASAGQFVTFNGEFSGPCSDLNLTLSDPEIDEFGSLCGICDDVCPPESCGFAGPCYGWCDWSGATIHIEAL